MNIKHIGPKTRISETKKFYRYKDNAIKQIKMYKVFRQPFDINNITNDQIRDPNFEIPENLVPRNFISFIVAPTATTDVIKFQMQTYFSKINVSWGDGTTDIYSIDSSSYMCTPTHSYANITKNYLVIVSPLSDATTIPESNPTNFRITLYNQTRTKYINSFGQDLFNLAMIYLYDQTLLEKFSDYSLEKVSNLSYFYCSYGIFEVLPDNIFKDCPNLIQVSFSDSRKLKVIPNNLFESKTNISYLNSCFNDCYALTSIPENLFKDCVELRYVDSIFSAAGVLTSIPENLFINCHKIENSKNSFYRCSCITKAPKIFSSNYLVDMTSIFSECTALTTIDEDFFIECPNVNNLSYAFMTTSLSSLPANLFKPLSKVTNMYYCFYGAKITSLPSGLFDTLTEVTTFEKCFIDNPIKTIAPNLFDYCTKVTTFKSIFQRSKIESIPPDLFKNCNLVSSFELTFASNLIKTVPDIFKTTVNCNFDSCFAHNPIENISTELFEECTGTINATSLFDECAELTSVTSAFKNKNISTINSFFSGCVKLVSVPNDIFSGCPISNASYAFYNCASLNYAPQLWTYLSPVPTTHELTFFGAIATSNYSSIPYDWRALAQPPS